MWSPAVFDEPAIGDRPPLGWRDWALWAAMFIAVIGSGIAQPDVPARWFTVIVGLVTSFTLLWRRFAPLMMTAIGFGTILSASAVIYAFTGQGADMPALAFVLFLPYAVFRWASGRDMVVTIGIMSAAWVIGSVLDPGTIGEAIGGVVVVAIPCLLGLVVRFQSQARSRRFDDVRTAEREQLARELHDSVAHHVSAIVIQAQAGRAVADQQPERAAAVLADIEDAATRALSEMRAMVGTLRSPAALAPQAGFAELDALADVAPDPIAVTIDVNETARQMASGPVQAAVYRIAQESITNAVRHGRDVDRIEVVVEAIADAVGGVRLTITDNGRNASLRPGTGYGLVGMRERVDQLGGEFSAGPNPDGGWTVEAVLPDQR